MTRSYRSLAAAVIGVLSLSTASFAAPVRARAHAVVGTLEKVDGQALTIQTPKGEETVTLGSRATIRSGAHAMTATDLSSHTGDRIKVRYRQANGQKQAVLVTLSPVHGQAAAAAGKTHAKRHG